MGRLLGTIHQLMPNLPTNRKDAHPNGRWMFKGQCGAFASSPNNRRKDSTAERP